MCRRLLCTICLAFVICTASVAEAQIVRVGPIGGVRVRAPFVSVDVLPYGGGTRVRAPFTSVDTGLYRWGYGRTFYGRRVYYPPRYVVPLYAIDPIYPAPVYPVPVYPEVDYPDYLYPEPTIVVPQPEYEAARPLVGSVRERLRDSALRLERSLSLRRDDGDIWLSYLSPASIIEAIDQATNPESLRELMRNYDGVVGNPSLVSIRATRGFADTRRLLREYIETAPAPQTETAPPQIEPEPADVEPADVEPAPVEELPPPKPQPALEEDEIPSDDDSGPVSL